MKTRSETEQSSIALGWRLIRSFGPPVEGAERAVSLGPRGFLTLGRGSDVFGPGGMASSRLSRRHASLRVDPDGRLTISDLDSHNGVRMNGSPVKHASVPEGAVIGIGGVILHALRTSDDVPCDGTDPFTGIGPTAAALDRSVGLLARRRAHAVFVGETGTGKRFAVEALHRRSGGTVLLRVDAAEDRGTDEDDALLAEAGNGTLYVDGVETCSQSTARLLRRLVMAETPPEKLRLVASAREPIAQLVERGVLRPEVAARLSRWRVVCPPLRARREDIPALACAFALRQGGEARSFHPRLLEMLCLESWPGNLHELDAAVGRLLSAAEPNEELTLRHYGVSAPPKVATPPTSAIRIHARGEWFELPGQSRVELTGRGTLCRLLAALLCARSEDANRRLTARDLAAAGWPEDDPSARAVINRVYVAMSTLRSLGLREALDRTPQGYRFDVETPVEPVESSKSDSAASAP